MADDLDTLFRLAGNRGAPDAWNEFFEPIGLILQIPPQREDYWCTPLNCDTFARTSGDGTHFSLVRIAGLQRDQRPVVMTVPMSDEPNLVVGENLRDFLALGCRTGYFALDGLVLNPKDTLEDLALQKHDDDADPEEIRLLEMLEATFALEPWANPKQRLAELKLAFHSSLDTALR